MKMSDSEKIALIDRLIADFWEHNTPDTWEKGGVFIVDAIASIINFGKE